MIKKDLPRQAADGEQKTKEPETKKTAKKTGFMEEMLSRKESEMKMPEKDDLIEGVVIDIGKQALYLDLGPVGAGVIYGRELEDGIGTLKTLKIGDKIKATVIEPENDEGYIELSLRTAGYEIAWTDIYKKLQEGEIVAVKIREANRGGLMGEIYGIKAFLPVSQLSAEHYPRVEEGDKSRILSMLNKFIGQDFKVKIIDANKEDEKLIISEKEAYANKEREAISLLKTGDIIEGVISGVVDFGAFVKFNIAPEIQMRNKSVSGRPLPAGQTGAAGKKEELEGLVHISELAWRLIENPKDIVKVGDKIKAKIIGIDDTRISLSIKTLKKDPWSETKYKVGDIVAGNVRKITPYGAFVYLDEDIHGLLHISEFNNIEEAKKYLRVGATNKFKILTLEPKEHRMGLTLAEKGKKETAETAAPTEKAEMPKEAAPKAEAVKIAAEKPETEKAKSKEEKQKAKKETKEKIVKKEKAEAKEKKLAVKKSKAKTE